MLYSHVFYFQSIQLFRHSLSFHTYMLRALVYKKIFSFSCFFFSFCLIYLYLIFSIKVSEYVCWFCYLSLIVDSRTHAANCWYLPMDIIFIIFVTFTSLKYLVGIAVQICLFYYTIRYSIWQLKRTQLKWLKYMYIALVGLCGLNYEFTCSVVNSLDWLLDIQNFICSSYSRSVIKDFDKAASSVKK